MLRVCNLLQARSLRYAYVPVVSRAGDIAVSDVVEGLSTPHIPLVSNKRTHSTYPGLRNLSPSKLMQWTEVPGAYLNVA